MAIEGLKQKIMQKAEQWKKDGVKEYLVDAIIADIDPLLDEVIEQIKQKAFDGFIEESDPCKSFCHSLKRTQLVELQKVLAVLEGQKP